MNSYLSILASDLKNTRRDPTLLLLFWVPLIMLCVVRFGTPFLIGYLPVLANYKLQLLTLFVVLNAIFPGFILSFILLDEKDMKLLPVISVTPVSLSGFLLTRIIYVVFFGFLGDLLLFFFNGMIRFPLSQILSISFLAALNAPILILLISTIAKNKVEGLTLLKVANVVVFIPAVVFFIETPWENFLGIFPAFWVYKFIDSPNHKWIILLIGTLVLCLFNYLSYRYANKKLRME